MYDTHLKDRGLVFPVYAGVILAFGVRVIVRVSVPRVCGGDPQSG